MRHHGNERYLSRIGSNVWANQEGSLLDDEVHAISTDSEQNVLFGGHTLGDIAAKNKGRGFYDVFVGVYDREGIPQWIWQNGTQVNDVLFGAKYDAEDYILLGGHTEGNMAGQGSIYQDDDGKVNYDIWLARWTGDGEEMWRTQFGTTGNDFFSTRWHLIAAANVLITGGNKWRTLHRQEGQEEHECGVSRRDRHVHRNSMQKTQNWYNC